MFYQKKDVLPNTNLTQEKNVVFVPGDLDLDLQSCLSKGQNMSSVGISSKSMQRFWRYFITKTKNHRLTAPKTEPSAVHCMR